MPSTIRATYDLSGILQGVGFRPTMARIVDAAGLGGWVRNQAGTVRLVLEGDRETIAAFIARLPEALPRQARLDEVREVEISEISPASIDGAFLIHPSEGSDEMRISIPADLASCADCVAEVFSPGSRFHRYAFTTCTNCGPRYTVVDGMPYDRERTALKEFPLCDRCAAEYTDPLDRRFHAESIACPECGPKLEAVLPGGGSLEGDPIVLAKEALGEGKVVAVKGLGGFLLAVDARNRAALERLRALKHRPHKPLAVMARDIGTARRICLVPDHMADLMASEIAPIAILDARPEADDEVPLDLLAPGTGTLGVMLPTTPIHHMLALPMPEGGGEFDLLVMTSGNRGGEPICVTNEEALERLDGIADLFLCHDRGINLRNDDSLVVSMDGAPQVWRRARGYAPEAIPLKTRFEADVVAMGAELKNTLALGFSGEVVLSPHIGDLETPEALDGLTQVLDRFPDFFGREPKKFAVDLHPDMRSTRTGLDRARELGATVTGVQHHHAHAASCMAEHGIGEALGIVFDGTGLGDDGAIWGAEILRVTPEGYTRMGTFDPVPLPGSDLAVLRPARQLVARWIHAGIEIPPEWMVALGVSAGELAIWRTQCIKGLNAPMTHAAGRVFDSYSTALGIAPEEVTYEGQAAVLLEAVARGATPDPGVDVPFGLVDRDGLLVVDWSPAFADLCDGPVEPARRPGLARAFHDSMAKAALEMARHSRASTGLLTVVCSGGVMMNRLFCETLCDLLRKDGFEVFLHRRVPPNDGGISLGQAVAAQGVV